MQPLFQRMMKNDHIKRALDMQTHTHSHEASEREREEEKKKRVRPERQEKEISRDWTNSTVDKKKLRQNKPQIKHTCKWMKRASKRKKKSRAEFQLNKTWQPQQQKNDHKYWMKEKVRVIHTTAFGCNLICILRTLNEIVYAIFFSVSLFSPSTKNAKWW